MYVCDCMCVCVCVCVCVLVCVGVTDDESRVKLKEAPEEEGSDYINACWMGVSLSIHYS